MSEFDKTCEECGEDFSSYIETICDDCNFEHQESLSRKIQTLTKQLQIAKEAFIGISTMKDGLTNETNVVKFIECRGISRHALTKINELETGKEKE